MYESGLGQCDRMRGRGGAPGGRSVIPGGGELYGHLSGPSGADRRLQALSPPVRSCRGTPESSSMSTTSLLKASSGRSPGCPSTRCSPRGGSIDELVAEGLLHPECARIFRPKNDLVDAGAQTDHAAPAPARGGRDRALRQELRPDHRHRLRQVAGLHRPDRRPGAAPGSRASPGSRRSSSTR